MSQLIICDPRSPEPWSDSALHNHGVKRLSPTTEIPTIGAKRILEPKFSPTAEIPNMNTKRDLEAKYSPTAETELVGNATVSPLGLQWPN